MSDNNIVKTSDWLKYERGIKYNNSLKPNYYDTVNTNIEFCMGNQWRNVQSNGQPTPTFNIMKRAITFFVSFIMSSKVKIKLSPLAYNEDVDQQAQQDPSQPQQPQDPNQQEHQAQQHASEIANNEIANLFEKFKMENKIRDACTDAATTGDVGAHMYFNPLAKPYNGMLGEQMGEIEFELIDGTNIFLGNANNSIISPKIQPYVIISGRDMVESLKDEAKEYKKQGGEEDKVTSDTDTQYEAGDMAKIEVEGDEWGKALYIIIYKYDKKTKTIKMSKCTENAYMFKDVDTGLSNYPVSIFCWEKQKNQYHGRALATGMISNQIFINKMFFMIMQNLMMVAFPVLIYDKSKIAGFSNRLGAQVGIDLNTPGDNVKNAASYLEAGNMSNQITTVIDMSIKYTKECLGLTDSLSGDVNPEQASGAAIATSVKQSAVPLESPKANMYEWVESIGQILVDMMSVYYMERPIVVTKDGNKTIENFDFSTLKNLWLKIKCDVGSSTYWSEIAQVQMLNNLLNMKDPLFSMIDFVEALPSEYRTDTMLDAMKKKQQGMQQAQQAQQQAQQQQMQQQSQQSQDIQGQTQQLQQAHQQLQYGNMAEFMKTLSPQIQAQLQKMPDAKMEQAVNQLMEAQKQGKLQPQQAQSQPQAQQPQGGNING